jgi:hypothetical protein
MFSSRFVLAFVSTALLAAVPLAARVSPHETISAAIDGSQVSVIYGRPYSKDPKTGEIRKIWGALVPAGKVWRTGADEATVLTTPVPLVLGGAAIPAGSYTLFTLLAADGSAKLIVNKQVGQWGTKYDATQDLVRVDLKKEALAAPVDQFTMALTKGASGGGILSLMWENTQYSVPFTVQK